jgi:hypothetical protein
MSRYYYGGAFQVPPKITKKFWDEVTERRKTFPKERIDTTFGYGDIGERPKSLLEKIVNKITG